MLIQHIQVVNYKGFRDSGQITIGRKFTVLVGQNNSGKTAFLEVLDVKKFADRPFKSTDVHEGYPPVVNPQSSAIFGIEVSGSELKWNLLRRGVAIDLVHSGDARSAVPKLIEDFFAKESMRVRLRLTPRGNWSPLDARLFPLTDRPSETVRLQPAPDRQSISISASMGGADESVVPNLIAPLVTDAIYVFRAERMNVAECPIGGETELRPDALNLASVLLQLVRDPRAQAQFTNHLRTVFPTIFSAVSRPKPNAPTLAHIEVINKDAQADTWQPGISIPLDDCGTGISQVLAILYVLVTAKTPRVIVIDEPNSFLHPGAAKKLLAILKEQEHQYIITTHSPEIVRAVEPDMLHLTKWTGRQCIIETLNSGDLQDLRRLLQELDVRLSDVFGADNVLWVEGHTEEICFPLLLKAFRRSPSAGTAVVATVNPSDLTGKRPRRTLVWELYERLTSGSTLIPPALAFSFDREDRTPVEIEDITRRSRGLAHFLPRRTYENYLLDAEAISEILNANGIKTNAQGIQAWIEKNGQQRRYIVADTNVQAGDQVWLSSVNAPLLLADLFEEFSKETPLLYEKLVHSVALTEWLIEHKPAMLRELVDYVTGLFIDAKNP